MPLIEAHHLSKSYGALRAVRDVSFSVDRGEVVGFLGPNGAGKSTTMKMLTGHLRADAGSAHIAGFDVADEAVRAKQHLGYSPEGAPAYGEMTVREFLRFAADLRGLADPAESVRRTLALCRLEEVAAQGIDTLSKGYRMRVGFAQAVLHDPEVLILDEPTDGLDPNQKHEVRGLIKRLGENKVVIFSTHILEEVEAACSRVIIIDRGRIVASGTPAELKARSPEGKLDEVFRAITLPDTVKHEVRT
jgi:ABC-2 type transport system ATP-binding protein